MKFTGTLRAPRIDVAAYTKLVEAHLLEELTQAAVAWLDATAPTIPEWSGASMATFLHLARAAKYPLTADPVRGSVPNRVNIGLGASEGGFKKDRTGHIAFFYSTTLPHLVWNEYHNANSNPDPTLFSRLLDPGPYKFQERGKAAFLSVAGKVRLPAPKFNISQIRIG